MRDDPVNRFLSEIKDGAVFCISDIPAGGSSHDSVKTRLSRACASGKIRRIIRGIYHKPRFNPIINDYVPYRIQDLVDAVSRMNGWRVLPAGDICLNILGLSTQVPAKHTYYSDGPNHSYDFDGTVVEFRHRSSRDFPASDRSAFIVQAVKARGRNNCDPEFMAALSRYIKKEGAGNLIEETRGCTSWVRDIIAEVPSMNYFENR
ncbi:MAG: DUF6088 family protein [archaeon]|nr:DUF6088 family protein [archaeon]